MNHRTNFWVLVALCAMSMSCLIVEICLTKFLAIKLNYHYAYALLSMVVFSFGVAGTFIYLRRGIQNEAGKVWQMSGRAAIAYAICLPVALLLFCWLPINPYPTGVDIVWQVCLLSLPFYFLLLAVPLVFAGVCVSLTLGSSQMAPTIIYFWDLLFAAVGASLCPLLLDRAGGYGAIFFASLLGAISALAYWRAQSARLSLKQMAALLLALGSASLLFLYPGFAIARWGFDIRSPKDMPTLSVFEHDFGGVAYTHWNCVARIDVSKIGTSQSLPFYRFGLSDKIKLAPIMGRMLMVDGAANTRQFCVTGPIAKQNYLQDFLWASPYIAYGKGAEKSLIIGGGGGVDVLIAKFFHMPEVDVVEFNPANAQILQGKIDDPKRIFTPWLESDTTGVTVFNKEARHFCTTRPSASYDIIQASGVDTLTAVSTGGLALTENYLYTKDAVADYYRLLRPEGILSLTHWRFAVPALPLRMFLTYLQYLEDQGVPRPWQNIMIVSGPYWTDTMLKRGPFSQEQVETVRKWAKDTGQFLLFDPYETKPSNPGLFPAEAIFYKLAFADGQARKNMLAQYPVNVSPTTDDKPYFYNFEAQNGWMSGTSTIMEAFAILLAWLIVVVPINRLARRDLRLEIVPFVWFFAACGFAFFLFETMIIQMFCIVVGGPVYSLSVVLVCVLAGYAAGSCLAHCLRPDWRVFTCLGILLLAVFLGVYFAVHPLTRAILPLPFSNRLIVCGLVTTFISFITGVPVSLSMNYLKEKWGTIVAWMWGISSAFNGLGAMSFVPIAQVTGIANIALIVGALYFAGSGVLALALKKAENA